MGVHSLLKHILENPSCRERVELQTMAEEVQRATGKKAKLLCDYFSVLKWLLSSYDKALVKSGQLSPYCVLCSGNVHEYGPRVKSFVNILTGIDVVPVFFIAGPPGSDLGEFKSKYEVYKSEAVQGIQHSALLQQITAGYQDLLQAEWRMDERAVSQVRATMKTYGAQVIQCLGEADHEIIQYLHSHEEAMGVLSHNTDFAVANGSMLFLPELFGLSVDSHHLTAISGGIACERIMPAQLSKSLRITERQLADLAVLCGNDYTKLFNHVLLENLGLDNHKVETVTEWLQAREEISCLLDYSNLREILRGNPTYTDLLKRSYSLYYNSCRRDSDVEVMTLPLSKPKSVVEVVQERVKEGSMQPSLLSIANGLYWRSVTVEPVTIGTPSIHDTTVFLRKTLYALMGLKQVMEHGRSALARFTIVPVQVKFAVESGVQQLASLEALTTTEKLSVLFHLVVNQKKLIRSFNLQDLLTVACRKSYAVKEGITHGAAILTCASLLFIQHANRLMKPCHKVKIGETDALLISCLACACDVPPYHYPHLPSPRAVTVSTWFTHVMDQVYLIASYLGLQEELPSPADIFSSLTYFPFHVAAFAEYEEDATTSLNLKGPYQFFDSVLELEPVLRLRAVLLNKPKTPNLAQIVELFDSSLKAVSSCKDSLDLPSKEVTFSNKIIGAERSVRDDFTFGSQLCPRDTSLNSSSDGSVEYNELSSTQECHVSEEDLYFSQQNPLEDDHLSLDVDHLDNFSSGGTALLNVSSCESVSPSVPDERPTTENALLSQDVQSSHPPSSSSTSLCMDEDTHGHRPPYQTELPVMSHREIILKLIKEHKVVCIAGETGCGKSTKIPQFILDEAIDQHPPETCKILITQPRRVAAIRLAERVAEERRERVGHTVGYCIGGERHRSSSTPITYCTIGYLLQSLVHSPGTIHKYTHIILDEIHERSIEADFTLLVLRRLIVDANNTKIIIMSATLQGDLLVDYFERVMNCSDVSSPYFVGAKRYPVESLCIDELQTIADRPRTIWHPCQAVAAQTLKCLTSSQPQESLKGATTTAPRITALNQAVCTELVISQANLGESILIFLPGIAEITNYFEKLSSELIARDVDDHFLMFILHSQIPFEDQKEAFQAPPQNKAHVILATNIAESSITLPNLRMVINFGIYRQLQYDPKRHMSCLVKRWCSQSSCAQRAGRAGRVFEGVAVHLFSRRFYRVILSEHDPPEILTAPIAKLVLQAKQIGSKLSIFSPSDFLSLAIEPPSLEQMEIALQNLANLGAIVSIPGRPLTEEAEITLLGHFSLSLPLELPLCRLVLFGVLFGVPTDAIVMAAAMSLSQDVFLLPTRSILTKNEETFRSYLDRSLDSRVEFDSGHFSDHILVRNMFMKWIQFRNTNQDLSHSKHGLVRRFCNTYAVRWERLLQLECTVADIATRVSSLVPSEYQLHKELTTLTSITHYRQGFKWFSSKATATEHGPDVSCINVHFCEDVVTLKALLVAAFSHQLMIGYRGIEALSAKDAESAIKVVNNMQRVGVNCSQSLLVKTQKASTPLQLLQLAGRVLPHRQCDVPVMEGRIFFLHFLPQFLTNPKTELMRALAEARGERVALPEANSQKIWRDFHNETSVSAHKPSKDLYLFWQFGERRPVWKVEGVDVQCTRPQHPLSVSWSQLSLLREKVVPLSWRNPTGFLCEFDMSPTQSSPLLGVASIFEGREYRSFVTAKGVTVLPNLSNSPVALLMALAFQTHPADVQLLSSCSKDKIVGMKINSCRIPFPDSHSLSLDDLVRINVLRGAMSTVLRSYSEDGTLLPMELMKRVPSLLKCVLKQTPLNIPTSNEAGPMMESDPPSLIIRLKWESIFSCERNVESDFIEEGEVQNHIEEVPSLSSFDYFPPIQCSLFESKNLALNSEAVVETETPFLFEVTATDTSHHQRKDRKRHFPKKTKRRSLSDAPTIRDITLGSFQLSPLARPFFPLSVDPLEAAAASRNTNNNSSVDVPLAVNDNMAGTQATDIFPSRLPQTVDVHTVSVPHSGSTPDALPPAAGGNVAPPSRGWPSCSQNSTPVFSGPGLHVNAPLHVSNIHSWQHSLSQGQTPASLDPALLQLYKHSLLCQMMSNTMLLYQLVENITISPTDGTLSFQSPITIGGLYKFSAATTQSCRAPQHDDIMSVLQPSHLAVEQRELQSTPPSSSDVECETGSSGEDALSPENEEGVSEVDGAEKEQVHVATMLDSPTFEERVLCSSDEADSVIEKETVSGVHVELPSVHSSINLEIDHQLQAPPAPSSQAVDGRETQETIPVVSIKPRSNSCPPFFPLYHSKAPPVPSTQEMYGRETQETMVDKTVEPQSNSFPPLFPLFQQQAPLAPSTQEMYGRVLQVDMSMEHRGRANSCPPFFPLYHPKGDTLSTPPAPIAQEVYGRETLLDMSMEHRSNSCPPFFPLYQQQAPPDMTVVIEHESNGCPPLFPPHQLQTPPVPSTQEMYGRETQETMVDMTVEPQSNSFPPLFPLFQQQAPLAPSTQEMYGRVLQVDMSMEPRGQANSCPPFFPLYQLHAPSTHTSTPETSSSQYTSYPQLFSPHQLEVPPAPSSQLQAVQYTNTLETSPSHYNSCPQLFPLSPYQSEVPPAPSPQVVDGRESQETIPDMVLVEQQGSCGGALVIEHGSSNSCPSLFPPYQLQAPPVPSTQEMYGREMQETMVDMSMKHRANSCPPLFPLYQLEAPPTPSLLAVETQETIPDMTVIQQASSVTLTDKHDSSTQQNNCPSLSLLHQLQAPPTPSTQAVGGRETQETVPVISMEEQDSSNTVETSPSQSYNQQILFPPHPLEAPPASSIRIQETIPDTSVHQFNSCPPLFPPNQLQAPPAPSSQVVDGGEREGTIPDVHVCQPNSCPPLFPLNRVEAPSTQAELNQGGVMRGDNPSNDVCSNAQAENSTTAGSSCVEVKKNICDRLSSLVLTDVTVKNNSLPKVYENSRCDEYNKNIAPTTEYETVEHDPANKQNVTQPYTGNLSPTEQAILFMKETTAPLSYDVPLAPPPPYMYAQRHPAHIPQGSLLQSSGPPRGPLLPSPPSNPPKHTYTGNRQQTHSVKPPLPGPRSPPTNPNQQYRVVCPKPIPRYMGPPPLPKRTYQPPPSAQVPPPFSTGFASRYTCPPWLSTMWPPSLPQKTNIPHKYVCYPREQAHHSRNRRQQKPKILKYNPFSDERLLKFYMCYLHLVGEMDLNILCGPVYCEYLERVCIATKERVLSSEFFLRKPDVFTVCGERMAYKVKLSCRHSGEQKNGGESHSVNGIIPVNLNDQLDLEQRAVGTAVDSIVTQPVTIPDHGHRDVTQVTQGSNGPIDDHLQEAAQQNITISQEPELQAIEHFETQTDEHDVIQLIEVDVKVEPEINIDYHTDSDHSDHVTSDGKRGSVTPPLLYSADIENEEVSDSQVSENVRQLQCELASEQEDGDILSQPQLLRDLSSDGTPSSGQPSPQEEEVHTEWKSGEESSEELVFASDKIRMAVKKYQEKEGDHIEDGQKALPDTNTDEPTERETLTDDLQQVALKTDSRDVSAWEEGAGGNFLEAQSVHPSDPTTSQSDSLQQTPSTVIVESGSDVAESKCNVLQEFPIEAHRDEESTPWLKVDIWDTSGQECGPGSQKIEKESLPSAAIKPTPNTHQKQAPRADTPGEPATSHRESSPSSVFSSCFDEDCWQEEPSITFPLAGELKQSDHSADTEVAKVKPLLGACSKASSFSTGKVSTKSSSRIGTPAHLVNFSREILANCNGMVYRDLCDKYRETFKNALPYRFYVPGKFFELRNSIFKTVKMYNGDYYVRVVSLVDTKSQGAERMGPRMKGRREKPRSWRRNDTGANARTGRERVHEERTSKPPVKERASGEVKEREGYGEKKKQKKSKRKKCSMSYYD